MTLCALLACDPGGETTASLSAPDDLTAGAGDELTAWPTCPLDGRRFQPTEPDFLGLVGNELQIAIAHRANLAYLGQQYAQAGTRHVRIILDWRSIERTPGRFDWGYTDQRVSAIAGAGIRTLGIIGNVPQWASSCPKHDRYELCAVADVEVYRRFVRQAVRHFGPSGTGQIRDWEIRIEANSTAGTGFDEVQYVAELSAAYKVIKTEDPLAKVWGPEVVFHANNSQPGGSAYRWVDYVIAHGPYDVFSIHHFQTVESAWQHTAAVRARLDAAGKQAVPLAVTAMNVPIPANSEQRTRSEAEQAKVLRDLYTCVSSAGADFAMWFAGTQWPDLDDTVYGVFAYDFSLPDRVRPRQAYAQLRALGSTIGQPPPVGPYGSLGASSNPCLTFGPDGTCQLELTWYSTRQSRPYVQLRLAGAQAACEPANRASSRTLHLSPYEPDRVYTLHPASSCAPGATLDGPLAQLRVSARPPPPEM